MIKNGIEKEIWPIIFKELADKKISYAITPNTYPKKETWKEIHHHELSICLEDPGRPGVPGSAVPWSCWLTLKLINGNPSVDSSLYVYLPRTIEIKAILKIMDHECFSNPVPLTLEDLPGAGSHYCLNLEGSILGNMLLSPASTIGPKLKRRIKVIDEIVDTLYIIEADPANKNALTNLTDLLLEMQ